MPSLLSSLVLLVLTVAGAIAPAQHAQDLPAETTAWAPAGELDSSRRDAKERSVDEEEEEEQEDDKEHHGLVATQPGRLPALTPHIAALGGGSPAPPRGVSRNRAPRAPPIREDRRVPSN